MDGFFLNGKDLSAKVDGKPTYEYAESHKNDLELGRVFFQFPQAVGC
jgi:hypothetical protein